MNSLFSHGAMSPSPAGRALMDRRRFLGDAASGLGAIALGALLAESGALAAPHAPRRGDRSNAGPIRPVIDPARPLAARPPHYAPKARRVLVLFCSGALSHVDTFDFKPQLIKRSGQPLPGVDKLVTFQGENGTLVGPLWQFRPRGESGKPVSDLLPHLAELADEFCFIHSMTAMSNTHGPAENQMSTGFTLDGYPGMGAWVSYALGTENESLPAFVAIPDPRGVPQVGSNHWNSAFLPSVFQGTAFNAAQPIAHLERPPTIDPTEETAARQLLDRLNQIHLAEHPSESDLAARIAGYELAARMQLAAVEANDLNGESPATRALYGIDDPDPHRAGFARNCLLARRLLERGVRFVQLFNGSYAMGEGVGNWDGHKVIRDQYPIHAAILDRPAAALIRDLKARGLLDDTLVALVTEFGRMPTFQKGANGRDHNPQGFTVLLAGAGVKRGHTHGATDEFGLKAVQDVVTIHDLHATILHLLGLDHTRLSVYHNGIERRLTDVHGHVIEGVLS